MAACEALQCADFAAALHRSTVVRIAVPMSSSVTREQVFVVAVLFLGYSAFYVTK